MADEKKAPIIRGKAYTPPVNKLISVSKSRLQGLTAWGDTDLFPQLLIEVINSSVTASACFDVTSEFLQGDGFADKALASRIIHPSGLRMDASLAHSARNVGYLRKLAFHVTYNALGQKVGFRSFDAEMVRLAMPNEAGETTHAAICPYLGNKLLRKKQKDFTLCNLFDDRREVVLEQIAAAKGIQNYTGQIVYVGEGETQIGYNPPKFATNAIMALETEAELLDYDFFSVQNGFNNAGMFAFLAGSKYQREDYDPLTDKTSVEYQFQNNLGAKKAGAISTYAAASKDELEAMKYLDFASKAGIASRYDQTNARIPDIIARAMNVPNELANLKRGDSVFANPDVLEVASQYMQFRMNRWQRFVKDWYERLLTDSYGQPTQAPDCTIANLNYFKPSKEEATQAGQ